MLARLLLVLCLSLPIFVRADSSVLVNKSTRNQVLVRVVWMQSFEEAQERCIKDGDAQVSPGMRIMGCYIEREKEKVIYAVEPAGFDDYDKLIVLGHEFWHALGANHS